MRPSVHGYLHVMAVLSAAPLDARGAAEHDEIGERDPLGARLGSIERRLDSLQRMQHGPQLGRLVDLPANLGLQTQPRPVGAAALVAATERGTPRPRRW